MALERGFRVLQAFSRTHPQLTLSEVAARTRLTRATARRSLHTLEGLGYLRRHHRQYLLAPHLLAFAAGYLESVRADEVLQPFLEDVVEVHGGHASVMMLDGVEVVCVAHASASGSPRVVPGTRTPAHALSGGRVLLAHSGPAVIQRAFEILDSHMAEGDVSALVPMLDAIRRKGFAIVENERDLGMMSVAVPIAGAGGRIVAAAMCGDHLANLTRLLLVEERLPTLRIAARSIERALHRSPVLAQAGQDAGVPN